MIRNALMAAGLTMWASLGGASTLDVTEASLGDFSAAVGPANPVVGTLDPGTNSISGSLSSECLAAFGGWVDCNRGIGDAQDSFAAVLSPGLWIKTATLTWEGLAPEGFRLVLNLRDLETGVSTLIGAPSGQASLSDVAIDSGPVHVSVIAGSADRIGRFDVTWDVAIEAVPLPSGMTFGLTALGALMLASRSASARRPALARR